MNERILHCWFDFEDGHTCMMLKGHDGPHEPTPDSEIFIEIMTKGRKEVDRLSDTDRGPASEYEVVWQSGHIDRFKAHQVNWPGRGRIFMDQPVTGPSVVQFHAEVDGRWQLILSAPEDEIAVIRNLTHANDEASEKTP